MSAHSACISVFIYMYWTKWLHPSVLNKWACRNCSMWPIKTVFPATRDRLSMDVPSTLCAWLLLKGEGFETIASPGHGLVSVKSGQSSGCWLEWLWVNCYTGMDELRHLPSLVVAQELHEMVGTQGTHQCLLWLTCCEARVGLGVHSFQLCVWSSRLRAVTQPSCGSVSSQGGAHPMLCGMDGIQDAYPAYLWHKAGRVCTLVLAGLGWGHWKWYPSALLPVIMRLQNGIHQYFHSWIKFLQVPFSSAASFKFSKWVPFTCSLGALQSVAFALDLRASDFVCKHIKGRSSVSYISMILLLLSPLIIKTICFVGLSFQLNKIIIVFI